MKYSVMVVFLVSLAKASMLVTPIVIGSGPYTYSYSIQNVGDDPLLEISFAGSGLITNIVAPSGWVDSTLPAGGDTVITWVSTDVPFDIVNGAALSGFGLRSSAPPGTVVFTGLTESFASDSATTVGPLASVPEPATFFFIAFGLTALCVWRKYARGQRG